MRLLLTFLALLALPARAECQSRDASVLDAAASFRRRAFGDTTPIATEPPADVLRRFALSDSVRLRGDSAQVFLTLRDGEHTHREVMHLIRRDGQWHVVTVSIDRILRLHVPVGHVLRRDRAESARSRAEHSSPPARVRREPREDFVEPARPEMSGDDLREDVAEVRCVREVAAVM